MKRGLTVTFFFGLLIGGLAALLVWYYQKSTSAEDGALILLDRLAAADRRVRGLLAEQSGRRQHETPQYLPLPIQVVTAPTDEVPSFLRKTATAVPEDLTVVQGIGPVFAERLVQAGIDTLVKLTAVSPANLAEILQIPESRAAAILSAAQSPNL